MPYGPDILAEGDYEDKLEALEHAKELGILIYQENEADDPFYIGVGPKHSEEDTPVYMLRHRRTGSAWPEGSVVWKWEPLYLWGS